MKNPKPLLTQDACDETFFEMAMTFAGVFAVSPTKLVNDENLWLLTRCMIANYERIRAKYTPPGQSPRRVAGLHPALETLLLFAKSKATAVNTGKAAGKVVHQ